MPSLDQLLGRLDALGNDVAVANAGAALEERAREDWIVAGLALRVERRVAGRIATAARTDRQAAVI